MLHHHSTPDFTTNHEVNATLAMRSVRSWANSWAQFSQSAAYSRWYEAVVHMTDDDLRIVMRQIWGFKTVDIAPLGGVARTALAHRCALVFERDCKLIERMMKSTHPTGKKLTAFIVIDALERQC